MPCRGSMANCMTLERMVMVPTAISPPYLRREVLKQTEMTLSLACIMKAERPRATQGRISFGRSRRVFRFRRRRVRSPVRKRRTQMQESPWERTVARAAPRTPIPKAKRKSGSKRMLAMAPMSTVRMPISAKPWAVMKAFMPRVSWTKRVPKA